MEAAAPVGVVGAEEASFALNEKYRVFNRVLGSGQAGVVRHGIAWTDRVWHDLAWSGMVRQVQA